MGVDKQVSCFDVRAPGHQPAVAVFKSISVADPVHNLDVVGNALYFVAPGVVYTYVSLKS